MNINATIIVQVINFFALYWIMKRWLIKPAGILVLQQQAIQQQFNDQLASYEKAFHDLSKAREHARQAYHLFSKKNMPSLECVTFKAVPISFQIAELHLYNQEAINTLVDTTVRALEQKIKVS